MAYNDLARALRRCQATCKDGRPCPRYAVWSDSLRRCAAHGGRVIGPHTREKTAYEPCTCDAYFHPHRPGSGLCDWPNAPMYRSIQRPGYHAEGREEVRPLCWNMPVSLGMARYAQPAWRPKGTRSRHAQDA
jgi:hypothetical protein